MKSKTNKTVVLAIIYVLLLIVEILFCVPYKSIEVFRSKQNVPHIEVIGSGYASIFDISDDTAAINGNSQTAVGKRVDTAQIVINVSLTTLIAAAIYFLFIFKREKLVSVPADKIEYNQLSLFDIVDLDNAEEITVHTLSPKNGYYKDVIERNEENAALIDKWLDKSTGCLYMAIMYKDGEAERVLVTKEFFDTLYKHFDL